MAGQDDARGEEEEEGAATAAAPRVPAAIALSASGEEGESQENGGGERRLQNDWLEAEYLFGAEFVGRLVIEPPLQIATPGAAGE